MGVLDVLFLKPIFNTERYLPESSIQRTVDLDSQGKAAAVVRESRLAVDQMKSLG